MAVNTINNPNTYVGDLNNLTTSNKSSVVGAVNALNSNLMALPTLATKNNNYITYSYVYVLKIGHLVNVSGRFQITTTKPAGQGYYLFTGLPSPAGQIVAVTESGGRNDLIVNGDGNLTSNNEKATGFYNIDVTYSTNE